MTNEQEYKLKRADASPWLRFHCNQIVKTVEEGAAHINAIAAH
jgi:hypothetical protein